MSTMDFQLEHIGYLTDNIERTAQQFELLGYLQGETVNDDRQKTKICFLRKDGETAIELVQPYDDNATMQRMLKKHGCGPYHLCYACDDVERLYQELTGENWTPLFKAVAAPALGNRKICYFFNADLGFVELVNKK